MIEVRQQIKFKLKHPIKDDNYIEIIFHHEKDMDEWFPYLIKFEDYLITEAIKAKQKK